MHVKMITVKYVKLIGTSNRHKSDLPQVLVDFFTSEKIDALINEQTANLIRT